MQEIYEIDEETMKMCQALEFYDEHHHFHFEKKKVMISLSYKTIEKLKKVKNKSEFIEKLM